MSVEDQEDRGSEKKSTKLKEACGSWNSLSVCARLMPKKQKTKKRGLSKVWNLISAEKQGRKHWSSGGRGGGFIAMEFTQTSALQKLSWKLFFLQSPPLFFFFFFLSPSRLQNLGQHYGPLARLTPFSDLFALLWNQDSGQELCPWRITFRTWAGVTLPVNEGQSEVRPLCHQKVTLVQRNGNRKKGHHLNLQSDSYHLNRSPRVKIYHSTLMDICSNQR